MVASKKSLSLDTKKIVEAVRARGPVVVGVAGVAVVGVIVGRASMAHDPAPVVAPSATASAGGRPEPTAQTFDITDNGVAHAGIPLRPLDRDIFETITAAKIPREQLKDVFPDKPYKVTLFGSISERRIGLVLIDMNRDGTVDERWEMRNGEVKRMLPKDPATNGQPVTYTLRHGRWQVH